MHDYEPVMITALISCLNKKNSKKSSDHPTNQQFNQS